jgi:dienelactone hydrolase
MRSRREHPVCMNVLYQKIAWDLGSAMRGALLLALCISWPVPGEVPQGVAATWALFDPRAEALETEVIRQSEMNGIVLRQLRYTVGTFGAKKTRVAAYYAFPEGGRKLPGIVQLHGGGQRALPAQVQFWAAHGYAAIAVNWGEKVIGLESDPNTDWAGIPAGFLPPKHHNGVSPATGTMHAEAHPWNSSWLLYAAAARRAITFLEQQPEADGDLVGLTGHSMGGRLTVLTAIDPRVKAASPSVGGSGYLYTDITGIPGSSRRMKADLPLYNATLDCRSYWPLIQCPVMFLGATCDFNSPMELVIRGFRSLPHEKRAMSFTPHMNHRFTADNYAARIRWFEAHLKKDFAFPKTATARLDLKTDTGIPRITIRPDLGVPHVLKEVRVLYGYDREPRVRFWRTAPVVRMGDLYTADLPVMDPGEPLFAFANLTYDTGKDLLMPAGYGDTPLLTISSQYRQAFPHQLVAAGIKATGRRQRLIEDFKHGWRDWSLVGVNHAIHWNYETHKVNDPAFVGPRGASLALEMETSEQSNTLAVIMETDKWRGYTGRKSWRYTALVKLPESGAHAVEIPMTGFVNEQGDALENYDFVTSLILTPGQKERPQQVPGTWRGHRPTFKNIRWIGGELAERSRTYLKQGGSALDADADFRAAFDRAVSESVEREEQDR